MRNRFLAMLVSVVLALGMMPAIALADEGDAKSYIALGDSISSGYGLEEGVGSFVDLFALENGLEADDSFAAPGMTSSDLRQRDAPRQDRRSGRRHRHHRRQRRAGSAVQLPGERLQRRLP